MESPETANEFGSVKQRLEEIAQAVADENMPLDEALDLYEEAVALGLKASDLLEVGIVAEDLEDPAENSDALRASDDGRLTAAGELELAPTDSFAASHSGPVSQVDPVGARASGGQVDPVGASSSSPGSPQANSDNAPNDGGVSTQA